MFVLHAEHVVDDLRVRLPFGFGRLLLVRVQIINAGDAVEIIERKTGFVAKIATHLEKAIRSNLDPWIEIIEVRAGDLFAKLRFQLFNKRSAGHLKSKVKVECYGSRLSDFFASSPVG